LLLASTIPACQAYDPAFPYEVAALVKHGIKKMYGDNPADIFYYITLYNENMVMPQQPVHVTAAGIINGLYQFSDPVSTTTDATILFSGTAYLAARRAADILHNSYNITVDLWSATSYKSLREDAMEVERWNRLHPTQMPRTSYVHDQLGAATTPIVAVSDFMRIVPEQIASYLPHRPFTVLGTDGMGRSDTRQALRRFFETDAEHIVIAVLTNLVGNGKITTATVAEAIAEFDIDPEVTYGLSRD
jgi:pyruvate dehydrogenase E1 component